jgi:hypothetical protein
MLNNENHIHPTAASPITAAAMAKPISRPLTAFLAPANAAGRAVGAAGLAVGAGAATPTEEGGRATDAALAPETGGAGAAGEAEGGRETAGGAAAAAGGGGGAGVEAGGGGGEPPAGKLGSLIVADEEGFGGKLMRTVSFLGWTFAASPGLGGTAPAGVLGVFSAIKIYHAQARVGSRECQTLNPFWKHFTLLSTCEGKTKVQKKFRAPKVLLLAIWAIADIATESDTRSPNGQWNCSAWCSNPKSVFGKKPSGWATGIRWWTNSVPRRDW